MRLLIDENVHAKVVARLRAAGYALEWIKETSRGFLDQAILQRPDIGSLVLITNDRDFGDLIFNHLLPTPYAVLYSRLPHRLSELTADRLIAQLEQDGFEGQMVTFTKDGKRLKPFPLGARNG